MTVPPLLKEWIKRRRLWKAYCAYRRVSIRLRFVNFFVHHVMGISSRVPWSVHYTSRVAAYKNLRLGRNVEISLAVSGGCYIQAINGIFIGDDTIFAPGVKIISANHARPGLSGWDEAPPIRIGKNCWLSVNAVILPGVELGDGVIVGAGAVVTKSFPSGSVIGGVPAKIIGTSQPKPSTAP